jgi:acyl homoserine lactone synthase
MLKLIEGSYASFFPKEIDAMFRNRAETFSDRLGWEVVVKDGYERDVFDDANPLYLVSVDPDTEEYWGSLRLMPTTGPNMLRDVFPQLLDGDYIESATIWESSRICAAAVPGQPERNQSGVNYVLSELILGIGEVAVAAGLTQIVSVFDARIFRVLRAAGCKPQVIGTPQRIGGVMCYAGLFDTRRGTAEGVSRRNRDRELGSCSGRQRDCIRLTPRARDPIGRSPSGKRALAKWVCRGIVSRNH